MERKIVWFTAMLAVVIGVGLGFLPAPANWDATELGFRFLLVASAITAVMHTGAATLFLTSLGAYKAQLRAAYICIALGVVVVALGTLQLPVFSWLNLWDSAWVQKGGIVLPFLVAGVALYAGARRFGRLVNARTILTKASVVVPAIIVLTVVITFLPHGAKSMPEIEFDASNAVLAIDGLFMLAAALIVLRIKNEIGEHYVNAMAWLFIALTGGVVVLFIAAIDPFFTNSNKDGLNNVITFLAAAAGVLWLRAAYAFAKVKEY